MLIECGQCGAPLDVGPNAQTAKCRYCGKTSRIQGMRMLAQQTPNTWAPPPRWRPPANVPADSNVELKYHRSPAGALVGTVIAIAAVGIAVGAVLSTKGGAIGGLAPAKLDAVTMMESPAELQAVVGGEWNESARWVLVNMRPPFQSAVFTYWGEDRSRPSGLTLNTGGKCSRGLAAARERLKEKLGRRFDGTTWHWASAHLSFDGSCSNVSFTVDVGKENDAFSKQQTAALWKLVREVVLQRPGSVDDETLRGLLGRGYSATSIAAGIAGMTIDDAMNGLEKKLPGAALSRSSGLQAQIPLAHRLLSEISVHWENKKAGPVEHLQVRSDKELPDPAALARCIAAKSGAKLNIRESDYAAKKSDASLELDGVNVSIHGYGIGVHRSGERQLTGAMLSKLMTAVDACPER